MQTLPSSSSADDLDDSMLARAIAAGDRNAFEALMRRHNRLLFRTARSLLRDDAEAEDAVQEAYLHAYRAIAHFRNDAKLSTWLTRIVINESTARLRKANRRAEIIPLERDTPMENVDDETTIEGRRVEQPDHAALRGQMRRLLEANIDALPENYRVVFVLRAVEEMSVEETARCLELPSGTVRIRFFRARAMLREALARQADLATEEAFGFDGARCDRVVDRVLARLDSTPSGNA